MKYLAKGIFLQVSTPLKKKENFDVSALSKDNYPENT